MDAAVEVEVEAGAGIKTGAASLMIAIDCSSATVGGKAASPVLSSAMIAFMLSGLFVAVGAQSGFVIGPAGFNLDPDFQVNRAAEQTLHIQPRLR